jgi:hypothetical protein
LQLPGAEPTIEDAPVFAIEKVEMNGSQLGLIQVTQLSAWDISKALSPGIRVARVSLTEALPSSANAATWAKTPRFA